jgi:hypothetical protein
MPKLRTCKSFNTSKTLITFVDFNNLFIFLYSEKVSNFYSELMMTNEDLMMGFKIRTENYSEVQRSLNEINQTLYRAQRLRGDKKN